jgi:hypothetical protein
MLCCYIRSFERHSSSSTTVTFCTAKSLATQPHLNCRYDEFCTHQQRQIRVDIFAYPLILPLPTPYYLSFNPHFIFYPFYKSELVALEKWVWKFEMRRHYVVGFLVLSFKFGFFLFVFLPVGFLLVVLCALWSVCWSVKMRKPLIFTMQAGNIKFFCALNCKRTKSLGLFFFCFGNMSNTSVQPHRSTA